MEQLWFHKIYSQMIFSFRLYCIKYRVFSFCPIQCNFTKTTSVDTHTLCFTNFDIWGCIFWVLAKMWEVAWFCFIQNSWLEPKYVLLIFIQILKRPIISSGSVMKKQWNRKKLLLHAFFFKWQRLASPDI